jgi:hypothetical protein
VLVHPADADTPADDRESRQTRRSSGGQLIHRQGYYTANHALARIARAISKQLWKPAVEEDGIPASVLPGLFAQLRAWKVAHLATVGVPADSTAGWDFLAAISACASDATYHVMWVIMYNAVDDFGVREENDAGAGERLPAVDALKAALHEEALHGALRIAGLAGVLASNGYLVRPPPPSHARGVAHAGTRSGSTRR